VLAITAGTLYERRFGVDAHPVSANLVQFAIAFLVLLPVAYAVERLRLHPTPRFGAALAYLALANSLISITLLLAMIRRGDAARVSALFFLVPPVAGLIALVVLGERVPPLGWVGMAIAAAGVALATRSDPGPATVAERSE
jgi:drug/metabolite transporter (DMT)-like permease